MDKTINALGLMSGTSLDGIDASLIRSDGEKNIEIHGNLYQEYDSELKKKLYEFCNKIHSAADLISNKDEFELIERIITIKHSEISLKICKKFNFTPKIVGFHGQTILHKPEQKLSVQMGNGRLLSQLLKKDVIYNFRENDLNNGGEGAPLTPIYHHNLINKLNLNSPVIFLNIGGIANYTFSKKNFFTAKDVGPGNYLMDFYLKKNTKFTFDKNGVIAASGKIDFPLVNNFFEHEIYNSKQNHSLDVKDFDINFVKGLSVQDAMACLNFFTAKIISENIRNLKEKCDIILCGGGRKNKTLVTNLKKLINNNIIDIDSYKIDGDFIESQAFAYLSVRSLYKKNISFPTTTNVLKPVSGGELIKAI